MENQVTVENKTTKELVIKVAKIVGNAVFYALIAFLLLFSIMNIRGSKDTASYPNIFGRGMLAVVSDSMDGDQEDSFQVGDLLIVKTFKEKNFNELEIGDVVTFFDPEANNGEGGLNSHRIVHILKDSNGNYLAIAEKNGQNICTIFDKTFLWKQHLDGEILQISMNPNGYVAVVTTDTTYKSIITLLDQNGKIVLKNYLSSATPLIVENS